MSRLFGTFEDVKQQRSAITSTNTPLAFLVSLALIGIAAVTMSARSHADSHSGTNHSKASLDFRIVVPAIFRVTTEVQPGSIVIEDHHLQTGYIDLDAATSVRLTNNTRSGYQLTAQYDVGLLSGVEVRLANQKLTASTGAGSLHVRSPLAIEQMVPISYRLHLAQGVRAGHYRWPVVLSFSLSAT